MMKQKSTFVFIALVVAMFLFNLCYVKIRMNEIGIKVNKVGSGVVGHDYEAGYYFVIPGIQEIITLDPTVQAYKMGGSDGFVEGLELVGRDQYTTRFDITITYRIKSGFAHRVAQDIGQTNDEIRQRMSSKARKSLWDALGGLNTQDFYDVKLREEAREAAKVALAAELDPLYLELMDILIRAIEYDKNLEQILVKKQLLDQQKALAVEKTLLERELEKTQSIERTTEAKVKVIAEEMVQEIANIQADTDAKINQIEADADLEAQGLLAEAERHRRTKTSEGELAKTRAKAKGEKAINEAYLAAGGQTYITRLLIESLQFGEIEVNTNKINPFDVNQFLGMLGLSAEKIAAGTDD